MSDDLITLWRYRDLPEALIAQSKLEAEGFDCFLADDNIVRLVWYWSNAIGGVRLRVRDEDVYLHCRCRFPSIAGSAMIAVAVGRESTSSL